MFFIFNQHFLILSNARQILINIKHQSILLRSRWPKIQKIQNFQTKTKINYFCVIHIIQKVEWVLKDFTHVEDRS